MYYVCPLSVYSQVAKSKQLRAGRKLNMCKEVDMSAAVHEVKEGKLKLRVAARA